MTLIFIFAVRNLVNVLVCHCKGLSERDLERAIDAGADSCHEVARRCGAGGDCGGCQPVIDELLEARRARSVPPAHELAFVAS